MSLSFDTRQLDTLKVVSSLFSLLENPEKFSKLTADLNKAVADFKAANELYDSIEKVKQFRNKAEARLAEAEAKEKQVMASIKAEQDKLQAAKDELAEKQAAHRMHVSSVRDQLTIEQESLRHRQAAHDVNLQDLMKREAKVAEAERKVEATGKELAEKLEKLKTAARMVV